MTDKKGTGSGVNVRELALYVLIEVTEKGELSHMVLRSVLEKYQYIDKRDRAFLGRLCEGTLEQQIRLDEVLSRFSSVPVRKMKPVIRNILRMGVYQLLFMDSVPDSAVCNESVKLAVKKGFGPLRGFVNGVLRSVARKKDEALLPMGKTSVPDQTAYLSVKYSMPRWIVELWEKTYAPETVEKMLAAFLTPGPTRVRCNTWRISPEELSVRLKGEGVEVRVSPYLRYALELSGYDHLEALQSFREGLFQVQDVSSMLVAAAAAPKEGDFCLDVCAAPGGKSLHLADLLKGTGMVEARDLTEYKTGLISENIARSGMENIRVKQWDALAFDDSMKEKADIVLADLPCSGLGIIGRKKDIKYKASPEGLESLAALQRQMLEVVSGYVKPGGTLIYSTCTVNTGENEENLRWFTEQFPFEPVSLDGVLCEELHSETTAKGYLQLLPGVHESDGFFLAKLKRMK